MSNCENCNWLSCESLDEDNWCCQCLDYDYDSMCSECRADHAADLADDTRKRELEHG